MPCLCPMLNMKLNPSSVGLYSMPRKEDTALLAKISWELLVVRSPGLVVHTCNSSTLQTEAERSQVQDQSSYTVSSPSGLYFNQHTSRSRPVGFKIHWRLLHATCRGFLGRELDSHKQTRRQR